MSYNPEASGMVYIGGVDQDHERCLRCGSQFLDTGWECTDCGYDNIVHYCPPEIRARSNPHE